MVHLERRAARQQRNTLAYRQSLGAGQDRSEELMQPSESWMRL
jgi:hypothetical protein